MCWGQRTFVKEIEMKIALSASYFNCPLVLEELLSCDIVFTSNNYAIEKLSSTLNIKEHAKYKKEDYSDCEIVRFSALFALHNKWIKTIATDEELLADENYARYFGTKDPQEMRNRLT